MGSQPYSLPSVCNALADLAPLRLAESWDNVGLLVGDRSRSVTRMMTCLTISPPVVREAIERSVDLLVAHHPLPFQPVKRITSDSIAGQMLWDLIGHQIAVYSAHTAFDSAAEGINQQIAGSLKLTKPVPLVCTDENADEAPQAALGAGRYGCLPHAMQLKELADTARQATAASSVRCVGDPAKSVHRIAIACGSGGSFLAAARRKGCDALVTGEANFHACLEAESSDIGLILVGHYASERFAMQWLAQRLATELPGLEVWASEQEADPLWSLSSP